MGVSGRSILILLFSCFTLTLQQPGGFLSNSEEGCECNTYRCEGRNCNRDTCFTFSCECACGFRCEQNGGDRSGGDRDRDRDRDRGRDRGGSTGWNPPYRFDGPTPVLYENFDDAQGLRLSQGFRSQSARSINFVPGQRGQAVRLDADDRQWIDLGIQTDVCMTQPDTCGRKGGACSMWLKVTSDDSGGIITSKDNNGDVRGFTINTVVSRHIMVNVYVQGATFHTFDKIPTEDKNAWFHVAVNYFGVEEGQGFVAYLNGDKVSDNSERSEDDSRTVQGRGRFVIGRSFTEEDDHYSSMEIDDLLCFNEYVDPEQITLLYSY